MQPFLPHGMLHSCRRPATVLTATQHCIFSWLRQESSQEKCPMCRQREHIFGAFRITCSLTSCCSLQIQESRRVRCLSRTADASAGTRHQSFVVAPRSDSYITPRANALHMGERIRKKQEPWKLVSMSWWHGSMHFRPRLCIGVRRLDNTLRKTDL